MTTETGKRQNYTEDFKRDAVALVTEQGYRISEASRELCTNMVNVKHMILNMEYLQNGDGPCHDP
jgi:hypothetical protein